MDGTGFFKHIKKDSDIPGLPLEEQEQLWEQISSRNRRYGKRYVRFFATAMSTAASICLLLALGWYAFLSREQQETNYAALMEGLVRAMDENTNDVRLILSGNKQVTIEGKESQLDYRQEGQVRIQSGEGTMAEEETSHEKFNQLFVPYGRRSSITLKDGTRIWVNSGSKVIYPVSFSKDKREIYVEGEVLLDVYHDDTKPFIVKTSRMDVKVLGTQFNVSAHANETIAQVVLVNGKVEILLPAKSPTISLAPNQMFSYDEVTLKGQISTVNTDDFTAWKDGYYPFKAESLTAVLKKLSRYYNVQFICSGRVSDLSCSGKLDLKEELGEVLNVLKKAAPIEIKKENENLYSINVKP